MEETSGPRRYVEEEFDLREYIGVLFKRGGLLSRNPETERYRLGVDLIGMATQAVSYMDVREVARPFLRH